MSTNITTTINAVTSTTMQAQQSIISKKKSQKAGKAITLECRNKRIIIKTAFSKKRHKVFDHFSMTNFKAGTGLFSSVILEKVSQYKVQAAHKNSDCDVKVNSTDNPQQKIYTVNGVPIMTNKIVACPNNFLRTIQNEPLASSDLVSIIFFVAGMLATFGLACIVFEMYVIDKMHNSNNNSRTKQHVTASQVQVEDIESIELEESRM